MARIDVKGTSITVYSDNDMDFISLTDMLKAKDRDFFISDCLHNRNTVEFLGIWEQVHNPDFNCGEFVIIKSQAPGSTATRSAPRSGWPKPGPYLSNSLLDNYPKP